MPMPDSVSGGLVEQDLVVIRSVLARNPRIRKAVLFGSRAKGTHRRGSDVDLALTGDALTREDVVAASLALNEESPLPYRFDVLDLDKIENRDLVEHINRVGLEIYRSSAALVRHTPA